MDVLSLNLYMFMYMCPWMCMPVCFSVLCCGTTTTYHGGKQATSWHDPCQTKSMYTQSFRLARFAWMSTVFEGVLGFGATVFVSTCTEWHCMQVYQYVAPYHNPFSFRTWPHGTSLKGVSGRWIPRPILHKSARIPGFSSTG